MLPLKCAQECWESCRDWSGCLSWYWCDQREGCTDADGRQYPFKGCELRSREVVRGLGSVPASWHLPTFATGFMKRAPLIAEGPGPSQLV